MYGRATVDNYHAWMCDLMGIDLPEYRNYQLLLDKLDRREFYFSNYLDKNRELDGHFLRDEYMDACGYRAGREGTSSVLEVLVALSIRIETEITGDLGNDHVERWFWVMIKNLGLDIYTDSNYEPDEVDDILDIWLDRKYKKNGKGSIFLTTKTDIDFREIDIWYQMQLYLDENWQY